jgi:hypothetical protein
MGMLRGVATINKATYEVIDPLYGERLMDVPISEALRKYNISTIIDHMHSFTSDAFYFKVRSNESRRADFGKVDQKVGHKNESTKLNHLFNPDDFVYAYRAILCR